MTSGPVSNINAPAAIPKARAPPIVPLARLSAITNNPRLTATDAIPVPNMFKFIVPNFSIIGNSNINAPTTTNIPAAPLNDPLDSLIASPTPTSATVIPINPCCNTPKSISPIFLTAGIRICNAPANIIIAIAACCKPIVKAINDAIDFNDGDLSFPSAANATTRTVVINVIANPPLTND